MLTSADIEKIYIGITQMSIAPAQSITNILKCAGLSDAPSPSKIQNIFSSVLGDTFHAMDRTKVPIKHEAKKAFFTALRDAFLMWNEEEIQELEEHMQKEGKSTSDIKRARYFSPTLYRRCVDRCVPPPRILYWRVRAVYVIYENMIDSKTKKVLFNDKAWTKANNVLLEILLGLYFDPPDVNWYTKIMRADGTVMRNKYGMEMMDCAIGTDRIESYHKHLIRTFGGGNGTGIEISVALLRERRHRHNHQVSEKKRLGFARFGHVDTWKIEELQSLVYRNHGILLYPDITSSSEYTTTSQSFDSVALQNFEVHQALKVRCTGIEIPKLIRNHQFLSKAMGTDLPFLPFIKHNEDGNMKFTQYTNANLGIKDGKKATVDWCRNFVNGINIMPKLPCHIRDHLESWERNQRIKELHMRTIDGRTKLEQLNKMTDSVAATEIESKQTTTVPEKQTSPAPSQSAPDPTGFVPIHSLASQYQEGIMLDPFLFPVIPYPPALPVPSAKSFHPNAFTIVASTMIGYRPNDFPNRTEEPKRKVRSDKGKKRKSIRRDVKFFGSMKVPMSILVGGGMPEEEGVNITTMGE